MDIITNQDSLTMTSSDLLKLINEQRLIASQNKIRNNDFLKKVEDEIDDLLNYETFVDKKGKTIKFYRLNQDQCFLVAMRESKSVRKIVLIKLRDIEEQLKPKLPDFSDPAAAARAWADEHEQKQLALEKIERDRPKVAFVDSCVERSSLMTATQVGQKHRMSATMLNRFLSDLGVYNGAIKRAKAFRQWFIDKGFGEMKQTQMGHSQCLFTTKGEQWVNEKLVTIEA